MPDHLTDLLKSSLIIFQLIASGVKLPGSTWQARTEYQADMCVPHCGSSINVCPVNESLSVHVTRDPVTKRLSGYNWAVSAGPQSLTRWVIWGQLFKFTVLPFLSFQAEIIVFSSLG